MLLIRSQFANLVMYVTLFLWGLVMMPVAFWSRDGALWVIRKYCAFALWWFKVSCGLRSEIRGTVPVDEVLIVSKHMSFLDILMIAGAVPRVKFIMKRELIWAPVLGIYAWRIGCPPVARGKKGGAIKQMVAHIEADAQKGHKGGQTVIFAQGTRVLPGVKAPYKVGAGVLYTQMNQPAVPAATNCGVFWARRSPYIKPGLAVVEFLDPIPPGLELRAFMEKIEDVVESNSDRLMREAGFVFPDGE